MILVTDQAFLINGGRLRTFHAATNRLSSCYYLQQICLRLIKTLAKTNPLSSTIFVTALRESLEEVKSIEGESNYRKVAEKANKANGETRENLLTTLESRAKRESWTDAALLEAILMIHYTSYVAMIEARNEAWPYDYMAFSRRMGELWEPFCKKCFEYPIKDLSLFISTSVF